MSRDLHGKIKLVKEWFKSKKESLTYENIKFPYVFLSLFLPVVGKFVNY